MDIIQLLPEYLDLGVDQEELVAVTQAALAQRIRDLKLAIGQAVVQARACTLLDNLEGSHQALQRARQLQREYHHFYAEWARLQPKAPYERNESGPQKPEPGPEVESKPKVPHPDRDRGLRHSSGRNPDEIGEIGA